MGYLERKPNVFQTKQLYVYVSPSSLNTPDDNGDSLLTIELGVVRRVEDSQCKDTALSREICLQSFHILTSVTPVNRH